MSQDSQSCMSDALAGDVSLNLGLVDPIDTDPDKCPSDGYGPKSVSSQRVCVKACETEKDGKLENLKVNVFARNYSSVPKFRGLSLEQTPFSKMCSFNILKARLRGLHRPKVMVYVQ